ISQCHKWLRTHKGLNAKPLNLTIAKINGERAYCFTTEQVATMIQRCRAVPGLVWLANVIVGLATTGMRIAELSGLKWADINFETKKLTLTDETGHRERDGQKRRQLKSGRGRTLPLHPEFVAVLKSMPRTDGLVYHGPRGGRLKPDTVRNIFV